MLWTFWKSEDRCSSKRIKHQQNEPCGSGHQKVLKASPLKTCWLNIKQCTIFLRIHCKISQFMSSCCFGIQWCIPQSLPLALVLVFLPHCHLLRWTFTGWWCVPSLFLYTVQKQECERRGLCANKSCSCEVKLHREISIQKFQGERRDELIRSTCKLARETRFRWSSRRWGSLASYTFTLLAFQLRSLVWTMFLFENINISLASVSCAARTT